MHGESGDDTNDDEEEDREINKDDSFENDFDAKEMEQDTELYQLEESGALPIHYNYIWWMKRFYDVLKQARKINSKVKSSTKATEHLIHSYWRNSIQGGAPISFSCFLSYGTASHTCLMWRRMRALMSPHSSSSSLWMKLWMSYTESYWTYLKSIYFSYNGEFYEQREGAAMGSPVPWSGDQSVHGQLALESVPLRLKWWKWYVDDSMTLYESITA